MKQITLLSIISLLLFSCSNSELNMEETENDSFYGLKVGNSWVYKSYKYNTETKGYDYTGIVDSVSVESKESISGVDYYKVKVLTSGNKNSEPMCNPNGVRYEFLRESNGSLIKKDGTIKFTNNNFEERFIEETSVGNVYEILNRKKVNIQVNAGEFNCFYSDRYVTLSNGNKSKGVQNYYYSEGYGLVYDTCTYLVTEHPIIIRKLDSYKIN